MAVQTLERPEIFTETPPRFNGRFYEVNSHYPSSLMFLHLTPYKHFLDSFSDPTGIRQLAGTIVDRKVPYSQSLGVVRSDEDLEAVIGEIGKRKPDVLGLSMPLGSLENAQKILDTADLRDTTVIIGGNLPTSMPEDLLKEVLTKYPKVIVSRGWGDKIFVDILNLRLAGQLTPENITDFSGLVYNLNGDMRVNDLQVEDASTYAGGPLDVKFDGIMVANFEASRNCSHPFCNFCARMPYIKREVWSPFPLEAIEVQVDDLVGQGVKTITATDEEALGTSLDHALKRGEELSKLFNDGKKSGRFPRDLKFSFSTRSDSIVQLLDAGREDIIASLGRAGLEQVFIGVETAVPRDFERWDNLPIPSQGRRYGKGVDIAKHAIAIHALQRNGILPAIGFIPFDLLMDLGELKANVDFGLDNDLAGFMSKPTNELRIQAGAKYEYVIGTCMQRLEKAGAFEANPYLQKDILGKMNPSTLQFQHRYLHPLIGKILEQIENTMVGYNAEYLLKKYFMSGVFTEDPTSIYGFDALKSLRTNHMLYMRNYIETIHKMLVREGIPLDRYDALTETFIGADEILDAEQEYKVRQAQLWSDILNHGSVAPIKSRLEQALKEKPFIIDNK